MAVVLTAGPAAAAPPALGPYPGQWGLAVPDFPGTLTTVHALQSDVGRTADYVMWYVHWGGPYNTVDPADVAAVEADGSTPVITWMSDDPTGATTITDQEIAAGQYDTYIESWAATLKATGIHMLLRFDPEMNGNWYGWSPGFYGQTAAEYVAAYQHVHDVFASVGASNVSFVWSPNVAYTGSAPMGPLYPGDDYVDYVGLDGYNWGPLDGHEWQSPKQVFSHSLHQLAAITDRSVLITEVASTSVGGNKAAWIRSFFEFLHSEPSVSGFIWFDYAKETDWQVDSSPHSLAAFRTGIVGSASKAADTRPGRI